MKYYDRIKNLREDNDLTQKELSELINIAQRTYSDYETGKVRIPIETLIMLAKYYNVDMNYISGLSKDKKPFPSK